MKKILFGMLFGVSFCFPLQAEAQSVQNNFLAEKTPQQLIAANWSGSSYKNSAGLPTTYAEFKKRCSTQLRSPEGAVKMYFDAVFSYMNPKTRSEGQKMLRYVMHEQAHWDKKPTFSTFVSRLKDSQMHYIFRSFAQGTSPYNGYEMSVDKYSLDITKIVKESDYTRVNLVSSGADSDRILWVKKFEDGYWYVINNAGSYAGVRPPAAQKSTSHDADYD